MKMQIEVYQLRGGNVHVVLRGRAAPGGPAADPDIFDRYVTVWRAFAQAQAPESVLKGSGPNPGRWSRAALTGVN